MGRGTAGVGSDHVDLNAANKTNGGITVAEVTGSNVVPVAEHVMMTILGLVRNWIPAHEQIESGDWNVAAVARNEFDLQNKVVGTVGAGRIGQRVLQRLAPFASRLRLVWCSRCCRLEAPPLQRSGRQGYRHVERSRDGGERNRSSGRLSLPRTSKIC